MYPPRYFKYYRLAALYHVVKNLRNANATARLRNTSLALGAVVTYQINALIYRPAEGRAETELLAAASQHIRDAEDSSSKPIMYDRGTFFWSDIVDDSEGFLLPNVRPVSSGCILALYRREFMDDIDAELRESQSQRDNPDATHTAPRNPRRKEMLKRKRKTTSRVVEENISDASDSNTSTEESTNMTSLTVASAPKVKDIGGLTDLLQQFPSDVLQLVPNPKSSNEEPWCLLGKGDVSRAKVELFQNLDICRVFRLAQCTMVCADDWQAIVFKRYFPCKSFEPPKSLQHFPFAAYYRQWRNLLEAADEGAADAIRETVRVWFNKILWLPFPEGDRMWATRRANGSRQWQMVPAGASVALSPRIAINVDCCDKKAVAELGVK
jgi:hypothetical protein